MEVESILSEEGKQLLVVNNFKFCVARKLYDDEIPWGCVNKKIKLPCKSVNLRFRTNECDQQ
jgi:hypothetical protein